MTATALKELKLADIQESKTNPRRTFDVKSLADLEASIREKGVLNPLLVRPVNGHFELVDGARRFRAAKKAGQETVPVLVRELDDDQALEVQVIANLQREGVHPLEEAEGYRALLKRPGYDVKAIASKVGKAESYVYAKLKLSGLVDKVKAAYLAGLLTEGHANLIARLGEKDQLRALSVCTIDGWQSVGDGEHDLGRFKRPITIRELSAFIAKELQLNLSAAPWNKTDAELLPKAGPCSTCPKRSGRDDADLFPDVKSGERCGDRACFEAKYSAWIARYQEIAKADGERFVAVSTLTGYSFEESMAKDLALPSDGWRPAKEGCTEIYRGLVVDGKSAGQTLSVCVGGDCRRCAEAKAAAAAKSKTDRYGRPKPTEKEKAERKAQLHEAKVDREYRSEVLRRISAKSGKAPSGKVLRLVLLELFSQLGYPWDGNFFEWKGWKRKSQSWHSALEKDFERETKDFKDPELWKLLPELLLMRAVSQDEGDVEPWAKLLGLDVKKIRSEVAERLKPKAVAKAKKEPSKKR